MDFPKQDTIKKYKLPTEVSYCKLCTMSNQRPRIQFDNEGICSACNFANFKRNKINWERREKELIDLCDKHRKKYDYDVIVPCSGGKDGGFVAHQLKYKYGMNPLTVTWSPLIPTEIGRNNLDNFINSGFDNILGKPNGEINKKLTHLATKYLGDPFQPFIYGQTNFPLQIAVKYGINLIFYGENGEVEYGGDMKNAFSPTRQIDDHDKHYFSGLGPHYWTKHGISEQDLIPYSPPKFKDIKKNKTEIHFFGYYKFWDPQENFYYCVDNTGFKPNSERSEGTYSKYASLDDKIDGFHYYLSYIKFGIGRTTSDASHEIRDGKITREEGIALVNKYDGEFPEKHYQEFLDYFNMTDEEFNQIIDCWRSDHLWEKTSNGWKLKKIVS